MDAVADGAIDPADAGELVLLVAVWVDPAASDETAVRAANRDAARRALDDAFQGDRAGRIDELLALRGERDERVLLRAASGAHRRIETRTYLLPLDPPVRLAWDPEPRTALEATLTIVRADDGSQAYASGAPPARPGPPRAAPGRRSTRRPTRCARSAARSTSTAAAPGRCEVAVWDLVGRTAGRPLRELLGGRSERITAYASTCEAVSREERVRRCAALRDALAGRQAAPRRGLARRCRDGRGGPRRHGRRHDDHG